MVADSLEANWNDKLRALAEIREDYDARRTNASTVELVHRLLNDHPINAVVGILGERGLKTGAGDAFNLGSVHWIMHMAKLKSLGGRLLAKGLLTPSEMAAQLGLSRGSVRTLLRKGKLKGRRTHENGRWLFYPPRSTAEQHARHRREPLIGRGCHFSCTGCSMNIDPFPSTSCAVQAAQDVGE